MPAAAYDLPFHKYGNLLAQTDTEVVLVSNGVTVSVNVAIVSQPPVVLDSVSIYVPAAVIVLPFHRYGNLFAQTETDWLEVSNGVTVRVNVAMVSQPPVVLDSVSIYVPAAVIVLPFHMYGNLFAQTDTEVVLVSNGVTVSVSVAIVSHPPVVLVSVSIYVPAAVIVLPFHKYGNLFAQTDAEVVLVNNGVTVRFSVAIVSQPPVVLASVSMYVPAAVIVLPFHKYGNLFAQTETDWLEVSNGVTVRVSVAIVSQPPVVLDSVSIYVPAAVIVLPFHRYGNLLAQTDAEVVLVNNGVTVRFNVAIVSQPPVVLARVSV